MKFLSIETATEVCGVSIVEDNHLIGLEEDIAPRKHASTLPIFYDNLKKKLKFELNQLDGIAVSIGPGSFTGLRIGLSYAKGLAFSHDLPIIPVPTLQGAAFGVEINTEYYLLLFSHRDMIFHQKFDKNGDCLNEATVSSWATLEKEVAEYPCYHIGCDSFLRNRKNAFPIQASAEQSGKLACKNFDDWIIRKPHKLVPNYIAPFEMNQRKSP